MNPPQYGPLLVIHTGLFIWHPGADGQSPGSKVTSCCGNLDRLHPREGAGESVQSGTPLLADRKAISVACNGYFKDRYNSVRMQRHSLSFRGRPHRAGEGFGRLGPTSLLSKK